MMMRRGRRLLGAAACLLALGALPACSMFHSDTERTTGQSRDSDVSNSGPGFSLFGHHRDYGRSAAPASIGVNSFLWRASLDTLNFMPLTSEDPFGGVIITDWYSNPSTPHERFRATVYILDTRLRADALNVSLFRQTQGANGQWQDATVDPDTNVQIENAILRRARELRLSTLHN